MNAIQALSTILASMKEARSFLSEEVLKMYETNFRKLANIFTLDALKAHSAFIGKMIDEKILATLVAKDDTMPLKARCHDCGTEISFRIRWVTISPDGSLATFTNGVVKENGQTTLLPRKDGEKGLEVTDFCWICRQKAELPKDVFWQSHIQAQKRLGFIRARAAEKRHEDKADWRAIRQLMPKPVVEVVEELTLKDLIPEPSAEAPTPKPEKKVKAAHKRAPRKTTGATAATV